MSVKMSVTKLLCMFSALAAFALLGFMPGTRTLAQEGNTGDVYVLGNQHEDNAVFVFHRSADGALAPAGSFSTGGQGAGEGPNPLHSQGSVILSNDNRLLFVVNAGSNTITAFAVSGDELTRLQVISSSGDRPVSLTISHDLLYVLNAGESPSISGFRIVPDAAERTLVHIDGSTQPLPDGGSAQPAEIAFAQDGRAILVTEAGTSNIASFIVAEDGRASFVATTPASSIGPFGLVLSTPDMAVAAQTMHGAPEQGNMATYHVAASAEVTPVSGPVMDQGTASTWAAITGSGRMAFTSNTMSGSISTYAVSPDGSLTLLQPVAASLRSEDASLLPSGLTLSNNSRYLYDRNAANETISGFVIHEDGSLSPVAHAGGLPETAAGITAR